MPQLLDTKEIKLEWSDIDKRRIRPRPTKPLVRSSGIHLSGVLKPTLVSAGLLNVSERTEEFPLRMALGMAWEDWAVGLWPLMKWQPGECSLDEIIGSPDGISPLKNAVPAALLKDFPDLPHPAKLDLLEEFKATWKSSHTRQDILKETGWIWQMAGYCKMLSLNFARLHVLWVNGTYRPPSPEYLTYLFYYPQAELDQFWTNVIQKNKHKAEAESH